MIPKLRFPEFTDEWHTKSFDHLFIFSTGKNIKQDEASPSFETPCVRYGELYHLYNEIIDKVVNYTNIPRSELTFSKGDEILLPSAGEDPMDIGAASALTIKDVAIGRTINVLRPKDDSSYNQIFVAYYINTLLKKRISKLAKGNSISNVYNSDLKKLTINLPTQVEQQKIADCLTTVDKKIEAIDKKIELLKQYKKSIVQKIFSQQIRFKDENENGYPDWNKKSLGEILDYEQPTKYIVRSTDYDESFKTPVLTAGKSFILGYTDETDNVYDNVPVIIFDDFTTASQFVDFPFKVKSSAMKILRTRPGINIKIAYELLRQIEYSAEDHKRHWIGEFQQFSVSVPCEGEQRKIADFLSSIDAKITAEETKLSSAKRLKKALLQKMFI